jgi:hypothetical protein
MKIIGVRHGVSKGVEDGHFRGGPPTRRRRVGHGGPARKFRESMATPCHTPMMKILIHSKLGVWGPNVAASFKLGTNSLILSREGAN